MEDQRKPTYEELLEENTQLKVRVAELEQKRTKNCDRVVMKITTPCLSDEVRRDALIPFEGRPVDFEHPIVQDDGMVSSVLNVRCMSK